MMLQAAQYAMFLGLLMLWVNSNSVDAQTERAFGYRSFIRTCKREGFSGRCCRTKFRCDRCSPDDVFPHQSPCSDRRIDRCAERKRTSCGETYLGGGLTQYRCQRKGTGSGTSYPLCDKAARGECNAFTCAEQKNFGNCDKSPIRYRATEEGEQVVDQWCWADEICGCSPGTEGDAGYFVQFEVNDDDGCCRD